MPRAVENLLDLHELRIHLEQLGVRRMRLKDRALCFEAEDPTQLVMALAVFADRLERPEPESIRLPFSHSVASDDDAIAEPHP